MLETRQATDRHDAVREDSRARERILVLAALSVCFVASCAATRIETHVAVVSVAPWENQALGLAPNFSLTADQALSQVVPETAATASSTAVQVSLAATASVTATQEMQQTSQPAVDVSPLTRTLSMDPSLRYVAATALYQQVQLLSTYVAHAAMRQGYVPYLVRLQIAALPLTRDADVDAIVDITLHDTAHGKVYLVPVVVSDTLEAAYVQTQVQQVYALRVGLATLTDSLSAGADLGAALAKASSAIGEAINGIVLLSSPSPHKARVRLGAQNSGDGRVFVPRSHFVSVLVLVPMQDTERLASYKPANDKVPHPPHSVMATVDVRYVTDSGRVKSVEPLQKAAKIEIPLPPYQDQAFRNCSLKPSVPDPDTGRPYRCMLDEGTTLLDTGESSTVTIGGLTGSSAGKISGVLAVPTKKGTYLQLRSTGSNVDVAEGTLKIDFPPVSKISWAKLGLELNPDKAFKLFLYRRSWSWYSGVNPNWPVRLSNVQYLPIDTPAKLAETKPRYAVATWASTIVADSHGTGKLAITVTDPRVADSAGRTPNLEETRIEISGADLAEGTPPALLGISKGKLLVKDTGVAQLSLKNLSAGSDVIVRVTGGSVAPSELRLHVAAPPEDKHEK